MIRIFLITMAGGFVSHFTKVPLDRNVAKEGWHRLTSYTLGIILLYPFVRLTFCYMLRVMGFSDDDVARLDVSLFSAYFGASVPFGLGTGIGWMLYDGMKR